MKKILSVIGLLAMLAVFSGCGHKTLENGGAYAPGSSVVSVDPSGASVTNFTPSQAPDYAFFEVESAFDFAYAAVDAAFKMEHDNRQLLWNISPDIKHTLDKLRPTALQIRNDYIRARIAYESNPVPANLSTMQTVLQRLQSVAASVQTVIPKPSTN